MHYYSRLVEYDLSLFLSVYGAYLEWLYNFIVLFCNHFELGEDVRLETVWFHRIHLPCSLFIVKLRQSSLCGGTLSPH